MSEIPENAGASRDDQGRFLPGVSGNPEGKKPGTLSITAEIKKKLQEMPEGKDKTYLHYLIEKIMKKAVIDEDQQTIKQIWNYIDGMPKESMDLRVEEVNPIYAGKSTIQGHESNEKDIQPEAEDQSD